jgi:hypothetical protein
VEKKDSVVVSGGEGVTATTLTRVDNYACSYTTINNKERRQRCVWPIDNPINVSRSVLVVPIGSMPRVGLDDRWFRLLQQSADNKDGSNNGNSSTMVRAAATTMMTLGKAPLQDTDGLPTTMPNKVARVGEGRRRRQMTRAARLERLDDDVV